MTLKRTPLKKGGGLKKGKSRLKAKPKTEEQKVQQQEQWEKDKKFYEHIWSTRPHICTSCDKPIHGELRTVYIEHCLEKSVDKYTHLRYCDDNIFIICFPCHQLKTNGFPTEKYQKIIDETRRKFNNGELCE